MTFACNVRLASLAMLPHRQSVVHIREVNYFVSPRLGVDCTHINDQHNTLTRITSCIPRTYHSCLTTFIWILKSEATPS
jgi:hypothetical protein